MKFYDASKSLYLETDASDIVQGAGLIQVRDSLNFRQDEVPGNTELCPIPFANKSLSCAEWQYSNIEQEAFGILHGLEKFHHYCFAKEVNIIKDHKPIGSNGQQIHCHPITAGIMCNAVYSSA